MTGSVETDIIAVAERKLAEAMNNLAQAEAKASSNGELTSPDEVSRLSREVGWRLRALMLIRGCCHGKE